MIASAESTIARRLRIQIFDLAHRALDVCEQHRDRFALALELRSFV